MPPELPFLSTYKTGLRLQVKVQPNASRTKILGLHGHALKIALLAPPVDGKANAALVEFLARQLGLSRRQVQLLSGETSRDKVILIEGLSLEDAARELTPH